MKRLFPSSLLGQVMAAIAIALMVAQIVSAVLLYRAGEERRETSILTAAAFQLVGGAERAAREGRRIMRRGNAADRVRRPPNLQGSLPRPLRYTVSETMPIRKRAGEEEGRREERVRLALAQEGIDPHIVAVDVRRAGDDPVLNAFALERPRFQIRDQWRQRRLYVVAMQRQPDSSWESARVLDPPRQQSALGILLFQTLVTFGFLIVILFLVLRRITRPLAELTDRVSTFSQSPERAVRLEETGPSDTRRLIAAHNAMETRIAALLDEKDVMLGAIGHDLKTPLAALRVRIESVPDEVERSKMAASIEDITATLDDILSLSRVGRDSAAQEAVEIGALAIGIAEEFEDLGEPVTIADPPRIVASIQVTWIKRALRNLVSNAVRYGEAAKISVMVEDGQAIMRVDDHGPGIPEDKIEAMLQPFTRGEGSRNRATGGAGLGLTLARAIAEQHGGTLMLSNRTEGGLRAEIRLPLNR